jgi:hypothetical protein
VRDRSSCFVFVNQVSITTTQLYHYSWKAAPQEIFKNSGAVFQ